MKKIVATIALATGLVLAGTSVSFAASAAPTIAKPTKKAKAGEGTATHEMSESSTGQAEEGASKPKTNLIKKSLIKKSSKAKATKKP